MRSAMRARRVAARRRVGGVPWPTRPARQQHIGEGCSRCISREVRAPRAGNAQLDLRQLAVLLGLHRHLRHRCRRARASVLRAGARLRRSTTRSRKSMLSARAATHAAALRIHQQRRTCRHSSSAGVRVLLPGTHVSDGCCAPHTASRASRTRANSASAVVREAERAIV